MYVCIYIYIYVLIHMYFIRHSNQLELPAIDNNSFEYLSFILPPNFSSLTLIPSTLTLLTLTPLTFTLSTLTLNFHIGTLTNLGLPAIDNNSFEYLSDNFRLASFQIENPYILIPQSSSMVSMSLTISQVYIFISIYIFYIYICVNT
jgi:hypothetical protein